DGAFMADVASMAARAASAAIDARLIISWGRFCRKFASGPWQIDNRWPELQWVVCLRGASQSLRTSGPLRSLPRLPERFPENPCGDRATRTDCDKRQLPCPQGSPRWLYPP